MARSTKTPVQTPIRGQNDVAHYFAYGSLIFDAVMTAVTGRRFERTNASLSDHQRYKVWNASYPGLVESPGDIVDGRVYSDVDDHAMQLLDKFEGAYYTRTTVEVTTDTEALDADTYVFREEYRHLLTKDLWDADAFEKGHLRSFLASYRGFDWIDQD